MAMFTAVRTLLLALILAAAPLVAGADDLKDLADAVERAELQYRIALRTLESSGREQTAAEVRLFRESLQDAISRLDEQRPPKSESDDSYAGTMLQIDMAIVGALIVIDIGSREAARAALTPIGERLAKLRERVDPR
jgi:Sec-independent protein translocase protein TatA